jgi:uncharacterized protein YidB (DUF937 family)
MERYCLFIRNEGVTMGLSHGLNGAHPGAKLDCVLNGFIRKQGGVTGVVDLFAKQGLGPTIQSWVGKGANQPISDAQIFRALGFATLQQLGAQLGLSPDEAAAKLSKVLPGAIEKVTAEGSRTTTPSRSVLRYFTSSLR